MAKHPDAATILAKMGDAPAALVGEFLICRTLARNPRAVARVLACADEDTSIIVPVSAETIKAETMMCGSITGTASRGSALNPVQPCITLRAQRRMKPMADHNDDARSARKHARRERSRRSRERFRNPPPFDPARDEAFRLSLAYLASDISEPKYPGQS